jgi:hypothetical protein
MSFLQELERSGILAGFVVTAKRNSYALLDFDADNGPATVIIFNGG